MTVWFTADTHFRHRNIMMLDGRPFDSIEEHDAELIRRWNEKVKPGDTVYHLGDFCFSGVARSQHFKNQLNGDIILIKGNHDGGMTRMRKVFPNVYKTLQIEIGGRKLWLSHRPRKDSHIPTEEEGWLLHGHTHKGGRKVHEKQINVNVMYWDYYPVSEFEISGIIEGVEVAPWWKRLLWRVYGQAYRLFKMRRLFERVPQKRIEDLQEGSAIPSRRKRRLLQRLLGEIQSRIYQKERK